MASTTNDNEVNSEHDGMYLLDPSCADRTVKPSDLILQQQCSRRIPHQLQAESKEPAEMME